MIKFKCAGIAFDISVLPFAVMVIMFTYDTSKVLTCSILASLIHEFGHGAAMVLLGTKPKAVSIGAFGIRITTQPRFDGGYARQIMISLAGPAVNLLAFGILYAASGLTISAAVHLVLALFNLLPVEPLDGGQVLYNVLCAAGAVKTADKLVTVISVIILAPLATAGFFLLLQSKYNFSLLVVCLYLVLMIIFKKVR